MQKTPYSTIGLFAIVVSTMVFFSSPGYVYGQQNTSANITVPETEPVDPIFNCLINNPPSACMAYQKFPEPDAELTNIQQSLNCWMDSLPHEDLVASHEYRTGLFNATLCDIQADERQKAFDLKKEDPRAFCHEVSNIDDYIALSQEIPNGCEKMIEMEYPNHERYGYTDFGDSTSIYLRPK